MRKAKNYGKRAVTVKQLKEMLVDKGPELGLTTEQVRTICRWVQELLAQLIAAKGRGAAQ